MKVTASVIRMQKVPKKVVAGKFMKPYGSKVVARRFQKTLWLENIWPEGCSSKVAVESCGEKATVIRLQLESCEKLAGSKVAKERAATARTTD